MSYERLETFCSISQGLGIFEQLEVMAVRFLSRGADNRQTRIESILKIYELVGHVD